MTGPAGDAEDLAAELTELLRDIAPHVESVAARGRGSFAWRTVDDDLTGLLLFDSAAVAEPALTRAGSDSRLLVFGTDLRSVEIEVLPDQLVGQFLPPAAGTVAVEGDGGTVGSVEVDELGFFLVAPVPRGLVRFRCSTSSTRLVTEWVRL